MNERAQRNSHSVDQDPNESVHDRRAFLRMMTVGAASCALRGLPASAEPSDRAPNIVVIFCDDLGYGDVGVYGHPTIRTPHIDRLAYEGQKWTSFYSAASICTPSRAGLLTGRLPIRSGMCSDKRGVLFPDSSGGLPADEITIAEALKSKGYATACVGKWHLGHLPQYLPRQHGFDQYYGIPYSNDMDGVVPRSSVDWSHPKSEWWDVPLMRNEEIIERPVDQTTITRRYTRESTEFIRQNKDRPFFLYFAHSFPHVPLFASEGFLDKGPGGLYSDVVEEIDWSVGQIVQTLRDEGLSKNTLVVFTSDNGPWLTFKQLGGSAGLLRGGKGTTWEGGMREPTVFWWPERIKPGVVTDVGSTLDIFATACMLAGVETPTDRVMDSLDLGPALFAGGPSPRETMFYYRGTSVHAVRQGSWKAHFTTKESRTPVVHHDPPLLFHLGSDPSEKHNVAEDHPDVIAGIREAVALHQADLVPGDDQLVGRIPEEG